MCCLFGFYNYSGKSLNFADMLTNSLSVEATARGTDATGISYVKDNKLVIYKKPKSAFQMKFEGLKDVVCVTGHTRHATQGAKDKNYNNHPFIGYCENVKFALAHNGVIFNDWELKRKYKLPEVKIETDSYIATQLLEHYHTLNTQNVKKMNEQLSGSFNFSIMDEHNNLWLTKGDNPLSIFHFPKHKLYVYASTDEILWLALINTPLFDELKEKEFEEIKINSCDILLFTKDGKIRKDKFKEQQRTYYGRSANWENYGGWSGNYWGYYDYGFYASEPKEQKEQKTTTQTPTKTTKNINYAKEYEKQQSAEQEYLTELKRMATYIGYKPEEIDELRKNGFTLDEIAELIYE